VSNPDHDMSSVGRARPTTPARATANEPPAGDQEPDDVPDELAEAAREEMAIPSDETDEG
jgi:hypothetical protein